VHCAEGEIGDKGQDLMEPEDVVAFDDGDVVIEPKTSLKNGSRKAMMSQAETHGFPNRRKRGERVGVNAEILEPLPLAGAKGDAGISRQAMNVFEE
jgi:hypothetical protein